MIADSKGFHLLQLSEGDIKAIQKDIYLKYNGSVSVFVHCVALQDDNDITKLSPKPVMFKDDNGKLFCQKALVLCWGMSQFQICPGANFEDGKDIWADIPNTYIDLNPYLELSYVSTCRSNKCTKLIPLRFNSYTCTECAKVMKTLKERNKSAKKEEVSDKLIKT